MLYKVWTSVDVEADTADAARELARHQDFDHALFTMGKASPYRVLDRFEAKLGRRAAFALGFCIPSPLFWAGIAGYHFF